MPPAAKAADADLKAAYQRGYDAAMAEPLDPEDPGIKHLTDQAYQRGYHEGLEAGKPKLPPFERAKQFVRTLIDVETPQLAARLDAWQDAEDVKLNSSDLNLLRTYHERMRSKRAAREQAAVEMRPAYSTTREPEPGETEYQAVT